MQGQEAGKVDMEIEWQMPLARVANVVDDIIAQLEGTFSRSAHCFLILGEEQEFCNLKILFFYLIGIA